MYLISLSWPHRKCMRYLLQLRLTCDPLSFPSCRLVFVILSLYRQQASTVVMTMCQPLGAGISYAIALQWSSMLPMWPWKPRENEVNFKWTSTFGQLEICFSSLNNKPSMTWEEWKCVYVVVEGLLMLLQEVSWCIMRSRRTKCFVSLPMLIITSFPSCPWPVRKV